MNFLKVTPPLFNPTYSSMDPPTHGNILVFAAIKVNTYTIGAVSGIGKNDIAKYLDDAGFEYVILKRKGPSTLKAVVGTNRFNEVAKREHAHIKAERFVT